VTLRFEHQTAAQRVLFGAQTAAQYLAAEVERRKSVAPFVAVTGMSADPAGRPGGDDWWARRSVEI